MKIEEIFIKIYRVIHSCETMKQLVWAHRYLDLAESNGYIMPEFRRAIFFSVYLDKKREIEANNAGVA